MIGKRRKCGKPVFAGEVCRECYINISNRLIEQYYQDKEKELEDRRKYARQ